MYNKEKEMKRDMNFSADRYLQLSLLRKQAAEYVAYIYMCAVQPQ